MSDLYLVHGGLFGCDGRWRSGQFGCEVLVYEEGASHMIAQSPDKFTTGLPVMLNFDGRHALNLTTVAKGFLGYVLHNVRSRSDSCGPM